VDAQVLVRDFGRIVTKQQQHVFSGQKRTKVVDLSVAARFDCNLQVGVGLLHM
jgi:hypothetical protein